VVVVVPATTTTVPVVDEAGRMIDLAQQQAVARWNRAVWVAAVERAEREAAERAAAERDRAGRQPAPAAVPEQTTGRCGGDLPPCWVQARESGGRPDAVNASGCGGRGCFGRWQFDPRTWDATAARAGRPDLIGVRPDHASAADQDLLAAVLWDGGHGCSHWAAC
jgi:hypothetical protein